MSNTFELLAAMVAGSCDGRQLDSAAQSLWLAYGAGHISDAQAEALDRQIRHYRASPASVGVPIGALAGVAVGSAKRARRVKAADARERQRTMAYGGWLPRHLAAAFTGGELAVLSVIAAEVWDHGWCDLHVGTIAYRAGVSERTVRSARQHACELNLISCHQRGTSVNRLGNVIRLVSAEWSAWLAKRPRKGGKMSPPCQNRKIKGAFGKAVGLAAVVQGEACGALDDGRKAAPQRKSPG